MRCDNIPPVNDSAQARLRPSSARSSATTPSSPSSSSAIVAGDPPEREHAHVVLASRVGEGRTNRGVAECVGGLDTPFGVDGGSQSLEAHVECDVSTFDEAVGEEEQR